MEKKIFISLLLALLSCHMLCVLAVPDSLEKEKPLVKPKNRFDTSHEKTSVIYAHGFGGSKLRVLLLINKSHDVVYRLNKKYEDSLKHDCYLFDTDYHTIKTFNFHDVYENLGLNGSIPNFHSADIAQKKDIEQLKNVIVNTKKGIIGYGYSRGATSWITTLGRNKELQERMSMIIVEAPFASIYQTAPFRAVDFVAGQVCETPSQKRTLFDYLASMFSYFFPAHSKSSLQPIDVIGNIGTHIPILLVHAKDDFAISINNSRRLYQKLVQAGHRNAYLLELTTGGHGLCLHGEYGLFYRNVVHALYKKYGLAHRPDFAAQGDLTGLQPSWQEVERRILEDEQSMTSAFVDDAKNASGDEQKKKESFKRSHEAKLALQFFSPSDVQGEASDKLTTTSHTVKTCFAFS